MLKRPWHPATDLLGNGSVARCCSTPHSPLKDGTPNCLGTPLDNERMNINIGKHVPWRSPIMTKVACHGVRSCTRSSSTTMTLSVITCPV